MHKHPHFPHVTIDGTGTTSYPSPAAYERAVEHELTRIYRTHTGKALFHEFANRTTHKIKIVPLEGVFNAFAGANDLRHATLRGHVERSGRDGHVLLDAHGKPIKGVGGGSDSVISYTPKTFRKFCMTHKRGHKSGAQPDEVLFHEMVHSTRQMRGKLDPLPLGYLYDTEEEFFAIVLANIYASETHREIDLRADHHGFEHLKTDTDARFLPKRSLHDYRYRLVSKLVHQEPKLAHELKRVHSHFNPIRRYYELQRTTSRAG